MGKHDRIQGRTDWLCHKCKGTDGSAYRNFASRMSCNVCHVDKGKCFLSKVIPPPPRALTLAERRVQQQRKGKGKGNASDEADKLRAAKNKITELQRKLEAKGGKDSKDADAMDDTELEESHFELTIAELKAHLQALKIQRPSGHPLVVAMQAQIGLQEAAQLKNKPPQQRLARAEQRIAATEKAQAVVESRQREVDEKLEALQARRSELAAQHEKAVQSVQAAKQEKDELLHELKGQSASVPDETPIAVCAQIAEQLPAEAFDKAGITKKTIEDMLANLQEALKTVQAAVQPAALAPAEPPAPVPAPAVGAAPTAADKAKDAEGNAKKDKGVILEHIDAIGNIEDHTQRKLEIAKLKQRAGPYSKPPA